MQGMAQSDSKPISGHDTDNRGKYIDTCPIGTVVAFRIAEKVKSAKIVKRNRKHQRLKVQTTYGKEFVIDYSDVVWVKLNNRWPRGVYNLLKGIADGTKEVEQAQDENN